MGFNKFFVKNWQFTLVIFAAVMVLGINALLNMPRGEDPPFGAPIFSIVVVYPGTNPTDMETLIADPIEEELYQLTDVKKINTTINDGLIVMLAEFNFGVDVEAKNNDVIREINKIRPDLPDGIVLLDIKRAESSDVVILQSALVSDTATMEVMNRYAESPAEVFEAALGRETELPKGKEADGILGDFVLRSDKVEATSSHNAPLRRANMSTFYGEDGVTPGAMYDLTLRGTNNDQLVIYSPCGHGQVSFVKIANVKEEGSAAVESVTTAAKNGGVFKRHEYRVKDGVQGIFITTVLRNETDKPQKTFTKDDFTKFDTTGTTADDIRSADAINPAHKCGYAFGMLSVSGIEKLADTLELQPKQEVVHRQSPH